MKLNYTISSNDKEILLSESFMSFDNEDPNVEIILAKGFIIKFKFDDKNFDKKTVRVATEIVDKVLILTFINFNSSSGTSLINPMYIGHIQKKKVYLRATIHQITEMKQIHLTIFIDKDIDEGAFPDVK